MTSHTCTSRVWAAGYGCSACDTKPPCTGISWEGKLQLVSFCVFEAAVGLFWPSMMKMRSQHVPEDTRSTIINFFRIPLNLFVCVVLYNVRPIPCASIQAVPLCVPHTPVSASCSTTCASSPALHDMPSAPAFCGTCVSEVCSVTRVLRSCVKKFKAHALQVKVQVQGCSGVVSQVCSDIQAQVFWYVQVFRFRCSAVCVQVYFSVQLVCSPVIQVISVVSSVLCIQVCFMRCVQVGAGCKDVSSGRPSMIAMCGYIFAAILGRIAIEGSRAGGSAAFRSKCYILI